MALPSLLPSSPWNVLRPVLLTGSVLALGGLLIGRLASLPVSSPGGGYRLVLETESDPGCYYGSAWNDGDVMLSHDASDGRVVTMVNRYDFEDDCTWEATETLTPNGAGYDYDYSERYVSCAEGARPALACARHGTVTVVTSPPAR